MNKKKLEYSVRKKIETTMIGAIARFEEGFGHLWGHNTQNKNQEQIRNKFVWDTIRNKILDHGNNQIRKLISEIQNDGNVDNIKYSYYYKFNNNQEDNK